ncbi:secreted protein [Herbihabitans rhizosphaerae]|uniref:Secreted protein n=1 Tax=Herbihabitans rhizosphaerae TaxID=1872711 RepID=A0A4V2ERA3_9PSEU|nr:FAD-binding protein [Herbihabitans rhizosphaerae]RZS29751.1 secreted protein [Herbihabitans rhizosphaerae]
MSDVNRRRFLTGTVAAGGALAVAGTTLPTVAGAEPASALDNPSLGPVTVTKGDPRYLDLRIKGVNSRFTTDPERFHLVGSTEQVVDVVHTAVRQNKRITVRGGGHSCENFVGDGAQVIIDLSELHDISFDHRRNAFVVEAGATLREVFKTLYLGWGVTVPGGQCGEVGVGGHFAGGGYGPQSRLFGSVVDYLYAVEVVVVDRDGRARAVVATREPDDPNRDLWWAHTGAGGGNFGVVTRYWLRDPKARGNDPSRLLPRPPGELLGATMLWSWDTVTEERFANLLRNYTAFFEKHSAPGDKYASLFSALLIPRKTAGADQGGFVLAATLDANLPGAERLLREFTDAVQVGVPAAVVSPAERTPWLTSALGSGTNGESGRYKQKSAYLKRRYTGEQCKTIYRHLTENPAPAGAQEAPMLWLLSYGGAVNAAKPDATAMPQRDSIIKAIYLINWDDAKGDADGIRRVREFYRDVYATTGGVPVPDDANDGCYINYPDVDTADPAWNTSGVPWHTLYFKDNYPRLQRIKAAWDPRDVFHHALSIRLP